MELSSWSLVLDAADDYAYFCSHVIRGGVYEKKYTIINKRNPTKG